MDVIHFKLLDEVPTFDEILEQCRNLPPIVEPPTPSGYDAIYGHGGVVIGYKNRTTGRTFGRDML